MRDAGLRIGEGLRAIVFDVDGTLYDQGRLRRAMLRTLVQAHLLRPVTGWRTAAVLRAYRRAQEELRHQPGGDVGEQQLAIACTSTGSSRAFVQSCVQTWMESAPLAFLP